MGLAPGTELLRQSPHLVRVRSGIQREHAGEDQLGARENLPLLERENLRDGDRDLGVLAVGSNLRIFTPRPVAFPVAFRLLI